MHGQNVATRAAERSLLRSPQTPLSVCGSPLRRTSANSPDRSRRLEPTFRSPIATARFRTVPTRSTLPVEPFDLPAKLPSGPFGLRLPSSRRFRRAGKISTGYPLPDSRSAAQPLPRLSAPRQGFWPPRITASIQFRDRKLTVAVRPISLRSPPASSLITSASGSSFQVRYVPPGSPFREPLGTISIMH